MLIMRESHGDIWTRRTGNHHAHALPICITTNGAVRGDGACVMGAGVAAQARARFPGIEYVIGDRIRVAGNSVHFLAEQNLVTFPVKHFWYQQADLELIELSGMELCDLADARGWNHVVLPRPGCGNGRLSWAVVKPVLYMLDDRFEVVERQRT
jgi:hypothetical protein